MQDNSAIKKREKTMKADLTVLKRILKSLERHTDDEQIEWATGGIEQAIEDMTLLPMPPKLPEQDDEVNIAELYANMAFVNLSLDVEKAITHKCVIMPMCFGKSWIALYAEQLRNPRCFAIWGLKYAVDKIKSSNALGEKRKTAIIDILNKIIERLKLEAGEPEKIL